MIQLADHFGTGALSKRKTSIDYTAEFVSAIDRIAPLPAVPDTSPVVFTVASCTSCETTREQISPMMSDDLVGVSCLKFASTWPKVPLT